MVPRDARGCGGGGGVGGARRPVAAPRLSSGFEASPRVFWAHFELHPMQASPLAHARGDGAGAADGGEALTRSATGSLRSRTLAASGREKARTGGPGLFEIRRLGNRRSVGTGRQAWTIGAPRCDCRIRGRRRWVRVELEIFRSGFVFGSCRFSPTPIGRCYPVKAPENRNPRLC